MNGLLLFTLASILLVASQEPIPSFSPNFVADVTRFNREYSNATTKRHVEVNVNASRAYVEIVTTSGFSMWDGRYWLILEPEGADPNTPAALGYVLFAVDTKTATAGLCSYNTRISLGGFPLYPPTVFPPFWQKGEIIDMSSWFGFYDTMVYGGKITYKDIDVNQWYSTEQCTLFGNAPQPCNKLFALIDDVVPVFQQLSHQKRPQTFEEDWIQTEEWNTFIPKTPVILPPSEWLTTCYNSQNGFNIDPVRGYVTCPAGNDNFTISLTSPPVSSLGDVTVNFADSASCTDCITLQTLDRQPLTYLTFTASNWDKPQTVLIVYVKDGESYFYPWATGGGYEIPHGENEHRTVGSNLRGISCAHCVPGYGCNTEKK